MGQVRGYGPARQCMICQLGLPDPIPCSRNSPPIGTGCPSCWLPSSLAHRGCSAPIHACFELSMQHCHAVMQAIKLHVITSWDIDVTSQGHWHHIPGTMISHPRDIGITSQGRWDKLMAPMCRNKLCHHNLDLPSPSFPSGWACKQLLKISTLQSHTIKGNISHLPAVKRHFVSS